MLSLLIRKELTDHLLSLRFYLSFVLCFVFMSVGIFALTREQVQEVQTLGPYLEADQYRQIVRWGSAVDLLNGGVSLVRPMPALRTVCTGLEDLSLIATLKGSEEPAFRRRAFVSNLAPDLFVRFDLVFVVGALVSLIAVNFTYDAVCGEKQGGTLRLTLAGGLPRHRFLMGKLLGGYLAFLVGYLPCLLMVCLILSLTPEVRLTGGDWAVLSFIFLLSILYASVFFSLGLFVSCRTASPPASLITLLGLWAGAVLVVPSLSPFLAACLAPASSPVEVEARINAIRTEAARRGWEEVSAYVRSHGLPHAFRVGGRAYEDWNLEWGSWVDALPRIAQQTPDTVASGRLLRFGSGVLAGEFQRAEGEVLRVRQAHIRALDRQAAIGQALTCLSPYASFTYLATDLSQTGLRGEVRFRRAVDRFKRDVVAYVGGQLSTRTMFDPLDAASFPFFQYRARGSPLEAGDLLHFLLLTGFNAVFYLGAHVSFMRYDVR